LLATLLLYHSHTHARNVREYSPMLDAVTATGMLLSIIILWVLVAAPQVADVGSVFPLPFSFFLE
jgi:hypothetical protein